MLHRGDCSGFQVDAGHRLPLTQCIRGLAPVCSTLDKGAWDLSSLPYPWELPGTIPTLLLPTEKVGTQALCRWALDTHCSPRVSPWLTAASSPTSTAVLRFK